MMEPELVILQASLSKLKIFLAWPGNRTVDWKYWLKCFVIYLLGSGLPFSVIMHIVLSIKYKEELDIKEDLAVMCSFYSGLYITIYFIKKSKQLRNLFQDLSDFTEHGAPQNFIKTRDKLNFLSKICVIYVNIGSIIYGIVSYSTKDACEIIKKEKNLHETCGLYIKSTLPFNVDYFPAFQITFFIQAISPFLYLNSPALISVLVWESVEYLVLKINQIRDLFVKILEESDRKIQENKLKACIKYHQIVLRIGENMAAQFQYLLITHVFLASFTCALTLSQITDKITAVIHLVGWMIALFFVCHAGQRLADESSSLGEKILQESDWYILKPSLQKLMQLLILRTQKPMRITAGPWTYLSYLAYIQVNKVAYSYYTLISART